MFNVRLAGGHLFGKQLFVWLSQVVSLMASFVLSFFPLDVLDEIWDVSESVSEGFLTFSFKREFDKASLCQLMLAEGICVDSLAFHFQIASKDYNAPGPLASSTLVTKDSNERVSDITILNLFEV